MPSWREDIDSLVFEPEGHSGSCIVHRRAFRTLLGRDAARQECLDFFGAHHAAFRAAAAAKIARGSISAGVNFHLTSRDVRRGGLIRPALAAASTSREAARPILDTARPHR
jgi:hypothetical protein